MVVKSTVFRRLSLILAASNLSDEEITSLLRHVRSTPIAEMLSDIRVDRALIDEGPISLQAPTPSGKSEFAVGELMGKEVAAQIERLLISEAGLTKAGAAQALQVALLPRHPDARNYPFDSKGGFSRWLRQVASDISMSEILHAAAMIRNSRVHSNGDDWINNN